MCLPCAKMNMGRNLCNVMDVHPETRKWTVVVQVTERHRPALSHPNRSPPGKRYRRHVATDSQGTRVSIVVYEADIRFYEHSLLPYKRYQISNAFVSPSGGSFRVCDYEYCWTVNNSILVEEVEEVEVPRLPCQFLFTRFSNFFKFADADIEINVRALVVHAFPSRQMSKSIIREFVMVDEEKRPTIISMWSDLEADDGEQIVAALADAPLIVGLRFRVTTFYSLSVSSRMSSYVMFNPPLADVDELRVWYQENNQEVRQLIEQRAYKDPTILLPYPDAEDIINIETAMSSSFHGKTAWVVGEAHVVEGTIKRWYAACSHCQKAINAEPEWVIKCPSCRQEAEIEIRCRIPLILKDGQFEMHATLFSPDAELLTPFNGNDLRQADESGTNVYPQLATALDGIRLVCFVKYFERDYQLQTSRKYAIIKAHPEIVFDDINAYVQSPPPSGEAVAGNDFFTPSTKKLLETLADDGASSSKSLTSPSGIKRNLRFASRAVLSDEDEHVEDSQEDFGTRIQSPMKKNKDVGEHVEDSQEGF